MLPWSTGPLPSSTAIDRMHIASTCHRIDSGVYGRMRYSSLS